MPVEDWGFSRNDRNELVIGGLSAVHLVQKYSALARRSFYFSLWSKL